MTAADITVSPADLPVQCLYRWERERPHQVYLTQPMGGGVVQDITWGEAANQVRRMAAWLQAQGWPAGSRIAIIGKNSAHWILADLAILMAGHISVPIYPTFNGDAMAYILQHSESRACFVGKMDDVANLHSGVPADLPLVALPLAPPLEALQWDDLLQQTAALQDSPEPAMDAICTIIYTSGTTGRPKGVVQTFHAMAWSMSTAARRVRMVENERFISYLPLAHVAERMLIEQGSLRQGGRIFFAESLDTFLQDMRRARPTVFFFRAALVVEVPAGRAQPDTCSKTQAPAAHSTTGAAGAAQDPQGAGAGPVPPCGRRRGPDAR